MLYLLAAAALAQQTPTLNAQLFRPTVDAGGLLWTDDAARARSGQATGRALFSYTADPLVYTYEDGERIEVVSDVLQADLLGAYTFGRLRLGADLPLYLLANGSSGGETGLGDIAADAKVSLIDPSDGPVGLALGGRLALPSATVETALGGDGYTWEVSAIADRAVGPVLLALNVGTRGLPEAEIADVVWDDQLFFRSGAAYDISDKLGASAELAGSFTYADLSAFQSRPLEALLGMWSRPNGGDIVVRYGVGTGLTTGVGAPTLRTLVAVAYEPPTGTDTDGDGLIDDRDDCPSQPEDVDRYRDEDGCPDPTTVAFRVVDARDGTLIPGASVTVDGGEARIDGTPLSAGGHDLTVEADGFTAATLRTQVPGGESHTVEVSLDVILPGRLVVRVLDPDGQPVEGASWSIDGTEQGQIGASAARLELRPGSYRVSAQADGHLKSSRVTNIRPDLDATVELVLKRTTIQVTRDRIDLGGKIYFETSKAVIKPESFPLLNDVATVMQEYPEIAQLRIEGHTDARGSASANQALSDARAASVAVFLEEQGIDPDRLNSIGYGESRPVDRRQSSVAYEKNRRVDFFVERWVEITRTEDALPEGTPPEEVPPEDESP